MDDTAPADIAASPPTPPPVGRPSPRGRWLRWLTIALGGLVAVVLAALLVLDSSLGHRFVVDRIAALTPGSGLRVQIGRIEGSLIGASTLRDVKVSDPDGVFLVIPTAELDWRPLSWLKRGLDVRELAVHRASLRRKPHLRPGDPNAPVLPNFDIRVDRLVIDNLTVEQGVYGARRRVDLAAKADIRGGRAILDINGRLGGKDRLLVHFDSEPDIDKFDLNVDIAAPKGGMLAQMAGLKADSIARVAGRGTWSNWKGFAWVGQPGKPLAGFELATQAGTYHLAGQVMPSGMVGGSMAQALGQRVSLLYDGSFTNSTLDGRLLAVGAAFRARGQGLLDLGNNRAGDLRIRADLTRPELLLASPRLEGVRIDATVDGLFRDMAVDHVVTVRRLQAGTTTAQGLRTAGVARWDGTRLVLPLAITADAVRTGNAMIDPRFAGGRVTGDLVLQGNRLTSENLSIALKGLAARLVLRGDTKAGGYALAGPVTARGFALPNIGLIDANAKILFKIGSGLPWTLQANAAGRMTRIDNATLADLTGGNVRFNGGVTLGERIAFQFRNARLTSPKLGLAVNGGITPDGRTTVRGNGRSLDYGPFTIDAAIGSTGPNAVLVFASPLPAAGLRDVRVAVAPIPDGFRIETAGQSTLGPFDGTVGLFSSPNGPTRLAIEKFRVWETAITGNLQLGKGGVAGDLVLAGGGLDGKVRLDPRDGGQALHVLLTARNAKFGGSTPLSIGNGRIEADGLIATGRTTVNASAYAEGIGYGSLFIGRVAANAKLANGHGTVTASLAGRRGTRFALQGTASIDPDRVVLLASGDYAGRAITMARRAVLTREGDGWNLAPTQIAFGRGAVIASGHVLGGLTDVKLQVARMPLMLLDIVSADLGLGGVASGIIDYRDDGRGAPTGHAAVQVKGLTRSGLVLTSRPVDLSLVAELQTSGIQSRAVIKEDGTVRGRLQARISGMPRGGTLSERLYAGQLAAQLRYSGPADALWRLSAVEVFDLTGTLGARADVTGTLNNPLLRGTIASNDLRIQSTLTGTDVRKLSVVGTFTDSRLDLARFSGVTPNGGRVSGSGTIDLSNIATRGVALDLRVSAANAALIKRDDMAATVTGPLRVVSDGTGGTIAGRVRIEQASWMLGRASAAQALPSIATREINPRADVAPAKARAAPWKFLIDAAGANRIDVRGLGLDSEWGADIRLRGDTTNPQIFGTADLVRGGYEFAGKRFELTRGRIRFAGEVPVDPRLDIVAEGDANGISAKISITGSGQKPIIAFSSVPSLPEEELLSRILFGSSITQISAPEAVQLASALASLRGGSGLDPINKLRSAIGLDRLRIVGADATTGRGTSIAVGKYLGRRFFVELVTDGRGYSATSVEFRITRWLALLATVSTLGNESVNLKASKDY